MEAKVTIIIGDSDYYGEDLRECLETLVRDFIYQAEYGGMVEVSEYSIIVEKD